MKKILLPLVFFTGFVIKSNSQASSKAKTSFAEKKLAATDPSIENVFPAAGFVGLGTITPGAPLEIKRGAGNTNKKNFLLKL